jgi:hypothetical protein
LPSHKPCAHAGEAQASKRCRVDAVALSLPNYIVKKIDSQYVLLSISMTISDRYRAAQLGQLGPIFWHAHSLAGRAHDARNGAAACRSSPN